MAEGQSDWHTPLPVTIFLAATLASLPIQGVVETAHFLLHDSWAHFDWFDLTDWLGFTTSLGGLDSWLVSPLLFVMDRWVSLPVFALGVLTLATVDRA